MVFKMTAQTLAFIGCCLLNSMAIGQNPQKEFKGVVTYIVDGDRFILESDKETRLVKMKWVDAPDDGQPLADEATTFLNDLILGREVVVLSEGDKQGCLFGELLADGINYNIEVVRAGFAHTSTGAPIDYINSALTAKKEKKGVWSTDNMVEPNSAWKSVAELQNGCNIDGEVVDYKTENQLKAGRDSFRYLTVPIYLILGGVLGFMIWIGLNRFDDPRIILNKKRLERNKNELKEEKKNEKKSKQTSKEMVESDKSSGESK